VAALHEAARELVRARAAPASAGDEELMQVQDSHVVGKHRAVPGAQPLVSGKHRAVPGAQPLVSGAGER
jgi:hypothetical protein